MFRFSTNAGFFSILMRIRGLSSILPFLLKVAFHYFMCKFFVYKLFWALEYTCLAHKYCCCRNYVSMPLLPVERSKLDASPLRFHCRGDSQLNIVPCFYNTRGNTFPSEFKENFQPFPITSVFSSLDLKL